MTPEEFKELKRRQEKYLDMEDDSEDNYRSGVPSEDDPQDWCPEHW